MPSSCVTGKTDMSHLISEAAVCLWERRPSANLTPAETCYSLAIRLMRKQLNIWGSGGVHFLIRFLPTS